MAGHVESNHLSRLAGADLSGATSQYKIVKLSSGAVVLATAATDKIIGVLDNRPASGEVASVWLRSSRGTIKVRLGGTVNEGDAVTTNGSGVGIATTTSGDQILGYCVSPGANASGAVIEVMPSTGKV